MKILIFGYGFTGRQLRRFLPFAAFTELPQLLHDDLIPFDFCDENTWRNLPDFDIAIITFKMTDQAQAEKFVTFLQDKEIILLSSARNLHNNIPDQVIDEMTPEGENERIAAEKYFAGKALILLLGLIWGNERQPQKWLSEGRIKNGKKFVNFIHVDDLCKIIKFFIENGIPKEKFLVSDGVPKRWEEIAEKSDVTLPSLTNNLDSRQFNTRKLLTHLPKNFSFTYPN